MQKSRNQDRTSPSVRSHSDNRPPRPASSVPAKTEAEATGTVTAVRLTRKFAEMIDGVDLTDVKVGDELSLTPREADVLIAEGWAERTRHPLRRAGDLRSDAADDPRPPRRPKS